MVTGQDFWAGSDWAAWGSGARFLIVTRRFLPYSF